MKSQSNARKRTLKDRTLDSEKKIQTSGANLETLVSDFVDSGKKILGLISEEQKRTQDWLKEFHRHIIAEYAKGPQSKVYGLIFANKLDGRRKIVLLFAETFEEALKVSEEVFRTEGETFSNWIIEGHKFLNFPKEKENVIGAVDKAMVSNKPVSVYLNDLQLLHDRFTETSLEKEVVTKLIERVALNYNTVHE